MRQEIDYFISSCLGRHLVSHDMYIVYCSYLRHGLLAQRNVVRPEGDPGDDLLGVALHDHAVVDHLVHGEHDHLHVVTQRLLVHVLPQDAGHGVEETIQHRHQQQLVLLSFNI